ncbi:MAG: hypothetical protein KDI39_16715, partial [Pseudomonadales bacterium]|nr:hypothetical protein [Pseudomonadales bacterium]
MIAALSGCGEDAKDCNGFWDKTFGREECLQTNTNTTNTNQTAKNTAVFIQLSSTATQGKKVEVMSMVDVVSDNAVNQPIQLDTRERDTVMALVDDKIVLFALKYDGNAVSLTPASTATYLVLQIKGMLDFPEQQLKQAIADIEADTSYPKLVSYINFKVQSGFSDPLNVEADPALMKLVVEISNKLDTTKYQTTSITLTDSSVTQQSYAVALPTRKSVSLGDVLLSLVGIQTANADESTIMGNRELVLGQPESNNVKFTNYTFNPFFAYINNDGAQSGKWNYIAGKGSIAEFDFKLADIEKAANIQADDGRFTRMLKRMAAIPSASIKDGKQETTLTLNGVNGSGKNTLYAESQGLCQVVLDDASIDEMTNQQLVASAINGFSLFMAVADVALKANELAVAQDALVKELTSPVNIAKSVAEYKKIKELLNKAKLEKEQALEKLEKIKMFNDFFKAFVEHAKKIKEENKLPIENELIFLEGALDATDKILEASESYVKVFNTTTEKRKSFLKELGSVLGETLKE